MNISFADLLEKLKMRFGRTPVASSPPPLPVAVDKPQSDKLAKTVLPNAIRTIGPGDSAAAERSGGSRGRMVSLGATPKTPRDLPPAVALALEPRVERVLSLALIDVIDAMPEGYLKPRESFDTSRRVLLKAADVEKGMASGKPKMPIATLYQQMPEIFMHSVPASDSVTIELPFKTLIDELSNLRVRQDQSAERVVSQYQTPFLQVAVEESEKFGTKMEPVQLTEFPRVRMGMAPATAEAIAAAEPEATAQETFIPSHLGSNTRMAARQSRSEELPAESVGPAPGKSGPEETSSERTIPQVSPIAGIPFSLQPSEPKIEDHSTDVQQERSEKNLSNGTGEPAFPRVPASSGPPVPPSVSPPTRIPFKLGATSEPPPTAPLPPLAEAQEKLEPSFSAQPVGSVVTLPLKPLLQNLPPMQLAGDVSSVPAETTVSFPLGLIAPQLSTGKVVVQPGDFEAALPPAFRSLFVADAIDAPVPLSLPEVLANLPSDALQMRADQEVVTPDEIFETPFSTKAAEDARRFASGAAANSAAQIAASVPAEPLQIEKSSDKREQRTAAETAKITISPRLPISASTPPRAATPGFDAKDAVAKASALPGVASCSVIFADGLSIAGNIPAELHVDGLSAMAPTLLMKLEKHMLETQLGVLTCLTVHGERSPVTFFASGNVCLTAVHSGDGELNGQSRAQLAIITQELSRTYSQPGTAHVDH